MKFSIVDLVSFTEETLPYKTDVGNFFADMIMLFLNIRRHLPRQLSGVDDVYLFIIYSNMFVNIRNT